MCYFQPALSPTLPSDAHEERGRMFGFINGWWEHSSILSWATKALKWHFLFVVKACTVMFGIRQNGAGAGGFSSTQGQRLFCISNLESMHCLLWGGSWGNETSWAITKSLTYTWTGHKQHLTVSQIHLSSLCWSSFQPLTACPWITHGPFSDRVNS